MGMMKDGSKSHDKDTNKSKNIIICEGCGKEFDSKNALFRHLRSTASASSSSTTSSCLSPEDYRNFMRYVVNRDENLDKIGVLYGYIPCDYQLQRGLQINDNVNVNSANEHKDEHKDENKTKGVDVKMCYGIEGGEHAAQLVLEAIQHVNLSGGTDIDTETDTIQLHAMDKDNNEDHVGNTSAKTNMQKKSKTKINRSYGCTARGTDIVAQDEGTGALTEILCARAPPIYLDGDDDTERTDELQRIAEDKAMQLWVDAVNRVLHVKILACSNINININTNNDHDHQHSKLQQCPSPGRIQVFGRITVPKKFNAEIDSTHRRVDYIMPADFLFHTNNTNINSNTNNEPKHHSNTKNHTNQRSNGQTTTSTPETALETTIPAIQNRDQFFHSLGTFTPGGPVDDSTKFDRNALTYFFKVKKLMQRFCTQVVTLNVNDKEAVLAKEFHDKKRRKQRKGSAAIVPPNNQQRPRRKKEDPGSNDTTDTGTRVQCESTGNHSHDDEQNIEDNTTTTKQPKKASAAVDNKCGKTNSNSPSNDLNRRRDKSSTKTTKTKTKARVLKRRRFHNFTPKVMAHEFLSYRRLDRFHHRGTVLPSASTVLNGNTDNHTDQNNRPFVVFSLSGDLFLNGQARAVIGLFIAIIRGYVHEEFLDCIFDEGYTSLVPAPLVPASGLYSGETTYMTWEGKMKAILSARSCGRYPKGFNNDMVRKGVEDFEKEIQASIMRAWNMVGYGKVNNNHGTPIALNAKVTSDSDGNETIYNRNTIESQWVTNYLEPWAKKATIQLQDYRKWKVAQNLAVQSNHKLTISQTLLPPLDSVTSDVPMIFQKVLSCLREANSSGLWPSTTPKRQLVMVSTNTEAAVAAGTDKPDTTTATTSLSVARIKSQTNTLTRTSAYVYQEGEGGASGSFSVGAMPGVNCEQPKGNTLFPKLMKAAFELEIALCPNREPSSTIAVNRNAHFRPHVDNGAGSGQSTSLIVGLGTYVGGQLVVEGDTNDIRYKGLQFNGWKQRHWTLPFRGERFSLVWFTPKGCEGIRGIDL